MPPASCSAHVAALALLSALAVSLPACSRPDDSTVSKTSAMADAVTSAPKILASALPTEPLTAPIASADPAPQAPSLPAVPAGDLGCPAGMARMNKTCIDRHEAALLTSSEAEAPTLWPHNQRPERGRRYEAISAPGVFPQGYMSRIEAADACKNAGKRLCSLAEWQRGCQGTRRGTYPYGAKRKAGTCNSSKEHLLSKLFGTSRRAWKYDEHFNSPQLLLEPSFLAKTGEFTECASDEGVHDMVGNLHEWVSDSVGPSLIERLDQEPIERRRQPWHEGNGVFMGGFFSTTREHGPGCHFITIAHEPKYHDYSIGFRCCASAETVAQAAASSSSAPGTPPPL